MLMLNMLDGMLLFCLVCGATGFTLAAPSRTSPSGYYTLNVFGNESDQGVAADRLQHAFDAVYTHFNDSFDHKAFGLAVQQFRKGVKRFRASDAYSAYAYSPDRPHCDIGTVSTPIYVSDVAPFPGGITQRTFGADFARSVHELSQQVSGPAAAGLIPMQTLQSQSLNLGMGMVQSVIAAMVHTVPPLIPPPAWNNQPLPCVPMVTGHNCFGAVLYPITMADFVLADVTDSMLDGIIAGFPNTYATKVGKTSNEMYSTCFASYMSMHCSSIFPRCTAPQSRDEPIPIGGRAPMCLHLCIMPLVMCPGFWVDDIIGTCSMVSVPPLCTQAFYWNLWRLPPQYTDFDAAHPFPRDCPRRTEGIDETDASENAALYDIQSTTQSPILAELNADSSIPIRALS